MRRQHALFADTLVHHTVQRQEILVKMWNAIDVASQEKEGAGRRVVVLGADSGRGKVWQCVVRAALLQKCAARPA
jgi:hypothetical protein